MLNTWNISSLGTLPPACMISHRRGVFQADVSMTASHVSGRMRGTLSSRPPPVMCAAPLSMPGGSFAIVGP